MDSTPSPKPAEFAEKATETRHLLSATTEKQIENGNVLFAQKFSVMCSLILALIMQMMQRQLDDMFRDMKKRKKAKSSKEGVEVRQIKQEVEDDKIYMCPLKKPKLDPSTDIQALKSVPKKLPNGLLLKPMEASDVLWGYY